MPAEPFQNDQIIFRCRAIDSAAGVTRETVGRLAERLGIDEAEVIHLALRGLAVRVLPQYEADDGALTDTQLRSIRRHAPNGTKRSVRTDLFHR